MQRPLRSLAFSAIFLVLGAFSVGASSSIAEAQAGQAALARQLRSDAVEAARSGDWARASELFERSYELAPRPLTLYNLAAAQMNVGRLVDADENFRRFLRDTSVGQHEQFRREAASSREALQDRIPYARIDIEGISAGDRVTLDDNDFANAALGSRLPINPGVHNVEVYRGEAVIARQRFEVEEGQTENIRLTVDPSSGALDPDEGGNGELNAGNSGDDGDDGGGGSVFASPIFWVITAVVLAAGAGVALAFILQEDEEPFQGTYPAIEFN
ncbi:MAG: hypothetical protein AAGF12_18220 [Myxococcota bacterium]